MEPLKLVVADDASIIRLDLKETLEWFPRRSVLASELRDHGFAMDDHRPYVPIIGNTCQGRRGTHGLGGVQGSVAPHWAHFILASSDAPMTSQIGHQRVYRASVAKKGKNLLGKSQAETRGVR